MATIKDIAKHVGVSCTTVSNVINNKSKRVSSETIEKINSAIADLGYIPNMSARSLVSNKSKVVAIINHIIPNNKNFMEDPFHSLFIGSLESRLRENGYFLMIRTIETSKDLDYFLKNWNLDGLILTGIYQDEFFNFIKSANKPTVVIDSYIEDSKILNVGLEDFNGGYIATKYLIEKGHKDIIFASPKINYVGVVSERFEGYKKALEESGIPFKEDLVYQQEFDINDTIELGLTLSKRKDFTAIFATADILAFGIMEGLKRGNKQIPEDISIIGFDDINLCKITTPNLTTINQDLSSKGILAANSIIELLEGNKIENNNLILPVKLVERSSVKDLKESR